MPFFRNKDSLSIYFEDINDDPKNFPIIFLHGQASSVIFFKHQISFLKKKKYRSICIDPIGLGRSFKPISINLKGHLRETYIRDIEDLLKHLKINNKFGILAHSLVGGMIAQLFTKKHPDKVKFLILLNSGDLMIDNDIRSSFWNVLPYNVRINFLQIVENSLDDVLNRTIPFIKLAFKEDPVYKDYTDQELEEIIEEEIFDMVKEAKSFDPSDIKCPTLIVSGMLDNYSPMTFSERLAEKIPNSELIAVEIAGHLAPSQIYKEINGLIGNFLKKIAK
ncbi:MAG: alpha/beta hydrolase [Candidatus Lokiarchaeota archaeon]|nr:alpha/beta hydrolase [Candidatus Lokiarchaeota archaeon]